MIMDQQFKHMKPTEISKTNLNKSKANPIGYNNQQQLNNIKQSKQVSEDSLNQWWQLPSQTHAQKHSLNNSNKFNIGNENENENYLKRKIPANN